MLLTRTRAVFALALAACGGSRLSACSSGGASFVSDAGSVVDSGADSAVVRPRSDASMPAGDRITVPDLPGVWEKFANGDDVFLVATDPTAQITRPAWGPCPWLAPGCTMQGPPNWYDGRTAHVLLFLVTEPARRGRDGKLRVQFHRFRFPGEFTVTSSLIERFVEEIGGPIEYADVFRTTRGLETKMVSHSADFVQNEDGILRTLADNNAKITFRAFHPWGTAPTFFAPEHVLTDPASQLSVSHAFNDSQVFALDINTTLTQIFARKSGDAVFPTRNGTRVSIPGKAYPIATGAFVHNVPNIAYVANNGVAVPLIAPHAPGTEIRGVAVQRDANLITWTEFAQADGSVRIWKSPLATRKEDIQATLVTHLLAYNDVVQTGGTTVTGSNGYFLSVPEIDTLLVTRLADGMGWSIKLGSAPYSVAEPRPEPMIVQRALWVDGTDVYATVGVADRDTVANERLVHYRLSELGPPTVLPRLD
jgi:hypothetical protein